MHAGYDKINHSKFRFTEVVGHDLQSHRTIMITDHWQLQWLSIISSRNYKKILRLRIMLYYIMKPSLHVVVVSSSQQSILIRNATDVETVYW